jgi:hypothetical protein
VHKFHNRGGACRCANQKQANFWQLRLSSDWLLFGYILTYRAGTQTPPSFRLSSRSLLSTSVDAIRTYSQPVQGCRRFSVVIEVAHWRPSPTASHLGPDLTLDRHMPAPSLCLDALTAGATGL